MHGHGFIARDKVNFVSVAGQQVTDLFIEFASEDRRSRNFVAIEVQYQEHGAVARGIQEVDSFPCALG